MDTTRVIGTFPAPAGSRMDDTDTIAFGTINPPTLAQSKVDDRGVRIPTQRLAEHAADVLAGTPDVPDLPCPRTWCHHTHGPDDGIIGETDRECGIDAPNLSHGEMWLTHHHGRKSNRLGTGRLRAGMAQGPDEISPRISVGRFVGDDKGNDWLMLTRDEAAELAERLGLLCDLAETPLPAVRADRNTPFWQVTACPDWCEVRHQADDEYQNRHHMGEGSMGLMGLVLMDAYGDRQRELELSLIQHYRSTAAVVDIAKSGLGGTLRLSMSEARELSRHLLDLVALADDDAQRVTR